MAGLSREGFEAKRLQEIIEDYQNRAKEIFKDLVPAGESVNVGPNSVLGRWIGLISPSDADLWEGLQDVYSAFDPNSATGIALDNLVSFAGITRMEATPTVAQCLFTGDTGVNLQPTNIVQSPTTGKRYRLGSSITLTPLHCNGIGVSVMDVQPATQYGVMFSHSSETTATFEITSAANTSDTSILEALRDKVNTSEHFKAHIENNILYISNKDPYRLGTFNASANLGIVKVTALGSVLSEEAEPIEQPPFTITQISTPVAGWDSVTNPQSAIPGRLRESDEQLRLRFRNSKAARGSNVLEALYSALYDVAGVEYVEVYENPTDQVDEYGIDPHSFMVLIQGGESSQIAQAIWRNKPLGIKTVGDEVVPVLDIKGRTHNVRFKRPTAVNIYVKLTLNIDAQFPHDGADQIKAAIVDYIKNTYSVGSDVIYSRLYSPINTVPGHQIESFYVGTTPDPSGTSNVVIDFDKIAYIDTNHITIIIA